MMDLSKLVERINHTPARGRRKLIAIAGAPASGKSTLAALLVQDLGPCAKLVPMDGFHLDNDILTARGLLDRKGAPQTFDVAGFLDLVSRLRDEEEILFPLFDRKLDRAIADADSVGPDIDIVVIEGNYLLLDAPIWTDLHSHWDLSVFLYVHSDVLRNRLIQRWVDHGLTKADAIARAEGNDLPNAELVLNQSIKADVTLKN